VKDGDLDGKRKKNGTRTLKAPRRPRLADILEAWWRCRCRRLDPLLKESTMRTRTIPILIAACLVATASCSDTATPTSPGTGTQAAPTTASQTTLYGIVQLSQTKEGGTVLRMGDGEVPLSGPGSDGLASVENAEVEVRGGFDADTFVVADFLVRRVGGSDVLDGVLITLYGQEIDGDGLGYALSLTRGAIVPLMDPPAELIAHVGARLWIVQSAEGQPSAFGIISR
jgi:hypothetical protein